MLVRMGRALAILLFVAGPALAADRYPAYTGYVVDTALVLDAQSVQRIRDTASRLDHAGIAQIAVLTVKDLGDQSPEDYAVNVFKKWGLGHQGGKKDDGVLVLMVPGAPGHRRTKVETGYDIEGVLPDGKLGALYDRVARPYILRDDYGGAASALVDAIAGELTRDASAGTTSRPVAGLQRSRPAGPGIQGVAGLGLAIVCMVVLLVALASSGARRRFPGKTTGLLAAGLTAASVVGLLLLGGAIGWIALFAGLVANGVAYASIRSHRCPRDGSWMVIDEQVVDPPTYWSSGLARVVEACSNPRCGYRREYEKELPRKQRTVYIGGGGGGGWGGGGFGGGGGGGGDGFSGGGGGGSGGGGISRSD
jgi:uncharacterized protein